MPIGEKQPLSIRYVADAARGVLFGWSVKGLDSIDPYRQLGYTVESQTQLGLTGEDLTKAVHEAVLQFFNGPLSADLNIPSNYPYAFYEPDKDAPIYTGQLRAQ
jgi:hypothetical protein